MATDRSASPDRAAHGGPRPRTGYDLEEAVYLDWQHRFVEHARRRMLFGDELGLARLADDWSRQYDRLTPEEAAEIAAMRRRL